MIYIWWYDETNRYIEAELEDWDAVYRYAQGLTEAPIDLSYINYWDGANSGTLNLHTFLKC